YWNWRRVAHRAWRNRQRLPIASIAVTVVIVMAAASNIIMVARMAAQLLHLSGRHIAVAPAGLLAFVPSRRTPPVVAVVIAIAIVLAVMIAVSLGMFIAIVTVVVGEFCPASAMRITV